MVSIAAATTDAVAPVGIYKTVRFMGMNLPPYRSPVVQVSIVGLVIFCTVGMSSALSGTGGGGQVDAKASDNAKVAIYATFCVLAFFGGTICNRIGVRLTLALGCFGYALYVAAFLAYNHINSRADPFVIVAGTIEGISAGLLWTAHGAIVMSYPTEEDKGKLFALCWAIFNFGSVVGSVISVALNWSNTTNSVTDGTYIAFLVIMLLGPATISPVQRSKSSPKGLDQGRYAHPPDLEIGICWSMEGFTHGILDLLVDFPLFLFF